MAEPSILSCTDGGALRLPLGPLPHPSGERLFPGPMSSRAKLKSRRGVVTQALTCSRGHQKRRGISRPVCRVWASYCSPNRSTIIPSSALNLDRYCPTETRLIAKVLIHTEDRIVALHHTVHRRTLLVAVSIGGTGAPSIDPVIRAPIRIMHDDPHVFNTPQHACRVRSRVERLIRPTSWNISPMIPPGAQRGSNGRVLAQGQSGP
jgi:hypothetical protein